MLFTSQNEFVAHDSTNYSPDSHDEFLSRLHISQKSHLMEGYLLKYITKIIQNLGYYASNEKKKI